MSSFPLVILSSIVLCMYKTGGAFFGCCARCIGNCGGSGGGIGGCSCVVCVLRGIGGNGRRISVCVPVGVSVCGVFCLDV